MAMGIRIAGGIVLSIIAASAAHAAPPKVAGTYATTAWHICQLVLTTPKSTVSKITATPTFGAITGLSTASAIFVESVAPQTDTFVLNAGGSAAAVTSVGATNNQALTDVQPTGFTSFVTEVDTTDVSAVKSVDPIWAAGRGAISMSVGTITFPAAASSSGSYTMSTVEVLGHAMRNDAPANNVGFARSTADSTGAFSFTTATLKLGTTVYDVSAGDVDASGVAHTINMLRRPKANEFCADSTTLTKR
jgi:hypothetical protein